MGAGEDGSQAAAEGFSKTISDESETLIDESVIVRGWWWEVDDA